MTVQILGDCVDQDETLNDVAEGGEGVGEDISYPLKVTKVRWIEPFTTENILVESDASGLSKISLYDELTAKSLTLVAKGLMYIYRKIIST